jgi:serine/threonine protein kinase/tetratricopeptide (TPR) repeat protein
MADSESVAEGENADFRATPRYRLLRRVGSGGFGVVYEAIDELAQTRVALKTLHRLTGDGLFTLKQEFRALADVFHPNLVALYEMTEHEGHWFFTMEFLDGVDFYSYVRPASRRTPPDGLATVDLPPVRQAKSPESGVASDRRPISRRESSSSSPRVTDMVALRAALPQLVEGVSALHQLGMLHRDLKPSNVMVNRDGRLILLDFGLVREHREGARRDSKTSGVEPAASVIVGTPEYMSPEQSLGDNVGPASDWYSVGTMLYEALAGRRPFQGTVAEVVADRQYTDPLPPSRYAANIPEDLESLAMALLDRDPARRPSGTQIARLIGGAAPISLSSATTASELLVGREALLGSLQDAADAVGPGHPVVCEIYGESGIGKTALVAHFVERLRRDRDALVLAGRCEERKAVPFKPVDAVIDMLSAHLRGLSSDALARVSPPRMDVLARIFPVIPMRSGVQPAIKPHRVDATLGPEAVQEDRRVAIDALTELLRRVASQRLVVIHVDDLQWGDQDSAGLLRDVLTGADAPGLLFIGAFRGAPSHGLSPFARSTEAMSVDRRVLSVEPLDTLHAEQIALTLLGRKTATNAAHATRIARECEGNPFFLGELARHIRSQNERGEVGALSSVSLSSVVRARVAAVPESAQSIVELLSVIGQPIDQSLLIDASGLGAAAYGALRLLRAANFVRFVGGSDAESVMLYHDRIRETVLASLSAEKLLSHHQSIVSALRLRARVDPALLATHLAGAGETQQAAEAALSAAESAEAQFAFDAAADWYAKAIAWSSSRESLEATLTAKLAFAYSAAGRNSQAAAAYRRAALFDPERSVDYRGRAMFHLLVEGRYDEGIALLREVADDVDLEVPSSSTAATVGIVADRAWLWLRGSGIRERDVRTIAPKALQRIDLAHQAGLATAFSDSVTSAYFLSQFMRMSLSVGEPVRAGMALMRYATTVAVANAGGEKRALELLRQAESISERHRDQYLRGCINIGYGFVDLCQNRWQPCIKRMERARELLRRVPGAYWELDTVDTFTMESCMWMGNLAEGLRLAERVARECDARGFVGGQRRYQARYRVISRLVQDDPMDCEWGVNEAMKALPTDRFMFLHFHELLARGWIANYQADSRRALQWLRGRWPALRRSGMMFAQIFRLQARQALGCALVNAAQETKSHSERNELLNEALSTAQSLDREELSFAKAHGAAIAGCIAALRHDRARAFAELRRSQHLYEAVNCPMYAASVKRLLGVYRQDDEGRGDVAECDELFRRQTVRNPARFVTLFAPDLRS